jgi:hypothetical protein
MNFLGEIFVNTVVIPTDVLTIDVTVFKAVTIFKINVNIVMILSS